MKLSNENATSKSISLHCGTVLQCCSHDLSACGRKRQSRKTCIVHAPLHTHQTICSNVLCLSFRYAKVPSYNQTTLGSGIDVGQGINVGHRKFDKKK